MEIELKDITVDNFEDVMELELDEDQQDFVADNAFSIAQTKFYPAYQPRAIYKIWTTRWFFNVSIIGS